MELITNHNCYNLCDEERCDDKPEYFERVKINGLIVVLGLCKKHSEKWENNFFEKRRKKQLCQTNMS